MTNTKEQPYQIITKQHHVPPGEGKKDVLYLFAPLIVSAYRKAPIETIEELTNDQKEHAICGAKEATHIVSAYIQDNPKAPIGLLAYSIYTPETHPEFYEALYKETHHQAKDVKQIIKKVKRVMKTDEMVVPRQYSRNGVSHAMREKALQKLKADHDQLVIVGNIQAPSSASQREKIQGESVWAGIPLTVDTNTNLLLPVADVLSRAFIATHEPEALTTYDKGLFITKDFDYPTQPITEGKPFSPAIRKAHNRILERQSQAKNGEIYSGMAITLCDFSKKQS